MLCVWVWTVFCLMCLCGVFVMYCVAWSVFVCGCLRLCARLCVCVCVVFGKLKVCCCVLSVTYGVRCCVVCDSVCVCV